jgi:hypothetical protein
VAEGEGLRREDLERIRRSLAMAPSLPGTEAHALLAEIHRLRADWEATAEQVEQLVEATEALRRRLRD